MVLCRIVPTDSVPETDKFCLWGPNKINIRNKVITFLIKIMQTTLFLKTFFESSSRLYTTSYRRDPQTKFKLVRYLCGTEPEGTILHNTKKLTCVIFVWTDQELKRNWGMWMHQAWRDCRPRYNIGLRAVCSCSKQ